MQSLKNLKPSLLVLNYAFPPLVSPNLSSLTVDRRRPTERRYRDLHGLYRSLATADLENERTLAIVKSDGVSGKHSSSIRKIILESGFIIQSEVTLHLDEDSVRRFYAEHSTKSFFSNLVKYMTSGPVLIMTLEKVNAIADWRTLIGPTDARKAKITHPDSIRAMCGVDLERNCVHGSDSHESAAREISFFFPDSIPEGTSLKHDEL